MTRKIFRSIWLTALIVLAASFLLILGIMNDYQRERTKDMLQTEAYLAAKGVESEGMEYFSSLKTGNTRFTWIEPDGTVFYDSQTDATKMENHLKREEVQEALADGYGESSRYSSTMMEQLLYSAVRMKDGSVLRLSLSRPSILSLFLGLLRPLCLIALAAVTLAFFMATRLARRIVKPLNEINLDAPLENEDYDELAPLLRRIDSQQRELFRQSRELTTRTRQLDTILSSMKEGMVLLGNHAQVISINRAAERLLDVGRDCVGQDVLAVTRNMAIVGAILRAAKGNGAETETEIGGRTYQIIASPIITAGPPAADADDAAIQKAEESLSLDSRREFAPDVRGVTVVLLDITEKAQAEMMRREFSANVSHELKTPLQSISGYAELLKDQLVKPEDIAPFAGKIYTEARRMIGLVDDIISISHLDEHVGDMAMETVDLKSITENCAASLAELAEKSGVVIRTILAPAELVGVPRLLHEIVQNLVNNAVKYNREGGNVIITLQTAQRPASSGGSAWLETIPPAETPADLSSAKPLLLGPDLSALGARLIILTVADDGIGIPADQQERIFERFYRVDKSRSKAVGGTGLGLSIVKHAVRIHGGSIHLRSIPGTGTEISVILPAKQPEK